MGKNTSQETLSALNNQRIPSKESDKVTRNKRSSYYTPIRRDVERKCDNETQYILFLFDTSGSISLDDFELMKESFSDLIPLFCKPVKVAMMTFDDQFKLEFCFDCFDNDCSGRNETAKAIRAMTHRRGYTYTAGATKCACRELLNRRCGLPSDASCIDVVYVTDGRSNDYLYDRSLSVCDAVQCLRERTAINTYAIGVGNYDQAELKCIADVSSNSSVFRFNNVTDLTEHLLQVVVLLMPTPGNNNAIHRKYACVNPQNSPSPPTPNDLENDGFCTFEELSTILHLLKGSPPP